MLEKNLIYSTDLVTHSQAATSAELTTLTSFEGELFHFLFLALEDELPPEAVVAQLLTL